MQHKHSKAWLGKSSPFLLFSFAGENLYTAEGEKLINCGAITNNRKKPA